MRSSRDWTRAGERIGHICGSRLEERELRVEILGELRRAIEFDAYAWLLTDPATAVGCAPFADVPCLPELPTLIKLKYLTAINRWTAMAGSASPVRLLRETTGGDLASSLIWRAMLHRHDVTDVA